MPDDNNSARRRGDGQNDYLEVTFLSDGDATVRVMGPNHRGQLSEAQVEFCAPNGGGYHPRTIEALHALAKAIQKDNEDPNSPERYQVPLVVREV